MRYPFRIVAQKVLLYPTDLLSDKNRRSPYIPVAHKEVAYDHTVIFLTT